MDGVQLPQDYRATMIKLPCWLNLLDTSGKYCKRCTLSESKKVKTRNSKFELLAGKFISLHYFLIAFFRGEVFFGT